MADSFTTRLLKEFHLCLRTDWGVHDMQTVGDTYRVVNGERIHPAVDAPYLVLAPPGRLVDTYGEAPLGEYDQSGEMDFIGFAPSEEIQIGLRIMAALDMAEEMERQLYTMRLAANAASYPLAYGHLLKLWMTVDDISAGGSDMPLPLPTFTGTIYWRRITDGGV